MNKRLCVILVVMFIFAFTCPVVAQEEPSVPVVAQAEQPSEPSVGLKIVDIVLVRLPCLGGSIASTAVYLAISPVVYAIGVADQVANAMVVAPWRFTAKRYLGQFNHYKDEKPLRGDYDYDEQIQEEWE